MHSHLSLLRYVSACQPSITTSELIRQRSNLRPVAASRRFDNAVDEDHVLSESMPSNATDEHLRLLREALERIKRTSATNTDSDDDDDIDDDFVD